MQLAIVNGKKSLAFPGGKGTCPICNKSTIAKCGSRIIHHWAHENKNCDPWWENETPWHRSWKNKFPIECREISHTDANGEIHRADIKTPTNIIIEIQHSLISDLERNSRENFYPNLIWLLDGSTFHKNFYIYHMLPDPHAEISQDIVWAKAKKNMHGSNSGIFYRISEAIEDDPTITKSTLKGGWVHFFHEIQDEILASYNGYHQYDWVKPRKTWLDSKCPIFIDFGHEYLVRLKTYDESGLKCIQLISKKTFLYEVMNKQNIYELS